MKRAIIIIIGEIMKYIYLDNNFYNRHPQINYPEILQKKRSSLRANCYIS